MMIDIFLYVVTIKWLKLMRETLQRIEQLSFVLVRGGKQGEATKSSESIPIH